MPGADIHLTGTPLMSPNCWRSIEGSVLARPHCRYLEWGSGNSTIALARAVLEQSELPRIEMVSIESDRTFADAMIGPLLATFDEASVEVRVRTGLLAPPKVSLREALRKDPAVRRHEANFLKSLWLTRNDRFWISSARPAPSHAGRLGPSRRYVASLRCSAAHRWERLRRAAGTSRREAVDAMEPISGTPECRSSGAATRTIFESDRLQIEYLVVPQVRNWLSPPGFILDGLYEEFADYVSAPVVGPFDVILVDGRARTSCLKRVHHDDLLASRGVLFLHDAHRPAQLEGLELFQPWTWVRGSEAEAGPRGSANVPGDPTDLQPPQVRSGSSLDLLEPVLDRELFLYERP